MAIWSLTSSHSDYATVGVNWGASEAAFWLFLDGLDETGSRLRYLEVQRLISNFAGKHPRTPVIVACRTSAFHRHSLVGFSRYSIKALDDDQIRLIVQRWFPSMPDLGADLLNRLHSAPRLSDDGH